MSLDINWLAVVTAAVVTFVVGGLWYGPMFGEIWRVPRGRPNRSRDTRSTLRWSTGCRSC